jgi:hypothetical protein
MSSKDLDASKKPDDSINILNKNTINARVDQNKINGLKRTRKGPHVIATADLINSSNDEDTKYDEDVIYPRKNKRISSLPADQSKSGQSSVSCVASPSNKKTKSK